MQNPTATAANDGREHWTSFRDADVEMRRRCRSPLDAVPLRAKTPNQEAYLQAIASHDLTLCVGPSGTSKSYSAIGVGLGSLLCEQFERLVLVRPMVECGRRLGAMPGEYQDKISPYMAAVEDTLLQFADAETIKELRASGRLSYDTLETMRGKTFRGCFVVLDEAQNVDRGQMLMFLTRAGEGTRMVVNGDTSGRQNDLPRHEVSGLAFAWEALDHPSIAKVRLGHEDIVRSGLVRIIVEQWERHDAVAR